ncbi:hypothetical protein SBOR_8327 [Sclerotinia borealis F-4128]|uniref:Aminotransferase class I/classII large domain-containing protein n=1 Tax=Sclerotinia borealis (strain F-4128) TaxID=1432307 RepID=W9C6F3_SCLBF|nr:hypothetical protein SBOR_8327 [Sclerotinia borealis F-4128]
MGNSVSIENSGLSARSRPKVAAFIPVLKNVDKNFVIGSEIDVDMAIGENWLTREPLIAIFKKALEDITEKPSGPKAMVLPQNHSGYVPFTKFRADVNIATTTDIPWRSATSINIVAAVKAAYFNAQDSKRVKALLMANPHNPTGHCYPSSVIRELMIFCEGKGLHYISDEIFAMSSFRTEEERKFTSALSLVDNDKESPMDPSRVHVIYSMSKDWGSPGLRMACLVSPRNRPVLGGSWI